MSAPAKYRKKPVVIEAMQYDGSVASVKQAVNFIGELRMERDSILIDTLEGTMTAARGWWIIKGVQGEFYPCDPEIFAKTYAREDTAWPEAEEGAL